MPEITSRRFTPASLQEFTSAARTVAKAYGLDLSRAQENLSRIYGFADFHDLRAHLATGPVPGPYQDEIPLAVALSRRQHGGSILMEEFSGARIGPQGRRDLDDLALFDRPHQRRAAIRHQDAIDQELDPTFTSPAHNLPVDNYVAFEIEHIEQAGEAWIEGKFRLTALGHQVWEALRYLSERFDGASDTAELTYIHDQIIRIGNNHPNNPYPSAAFVDLFADQKKAVSADVLTRAAERSIALFDALVPSDFKGTIEPKLIGSWVENRLYHSVLYRGGLAADEAGHPKLGRRWLKQCYRACKRDPYGIRFVLGYSTPEEELASG